MDTAFSPSVPSLSWRHICALVIVVAVAWIVAFDNGQLLEALGARAAAGANLLHEFFHDGRHLLGFPCH